MENKKPVFQTPRGRLAASNSQVGVITQPLPPGDTKSEESYVSFTLKCK